MSKWVTELAFRLADGNSQIDHSERVRANFGRTVSLSSFFVVSVDGSTLMRRLSRSFGANSR